MKKIGLIPCRLESTRLPNKPIKIIEGFPMFVHVHKRASLSELDEVYVCTDSLKISEISNKYDIKCIMTSSKNKNGTERCYEAATKLNLSNETTIVDIQGDEPLVNPDHINDLLKKFDKSKTEILVPYLESNDFENKNIVKLVANKSLEVLYMSRFDIPFLFKAHDTIKKHYSIIAFTVDSLKRFSELDPSKLEMTEGIELLRALENGIKVSTMKLIGETRAVDTYDDLKYVRNEMRFDSVYRLYKDK